MFSKSGKKLERTLEKNCEECKRTFKTERSNKQFCSDICRVRNWQKRFPRIDPATGEIKQRA